MGLLQQGMHNVRVSLLQNNNIQLNKHLRLELKQFLNQQGNRIGINDYRVDNDYPNLDQKRTALYFRSSFLYSGQLSTHLTFGANDGTKIYTNVGYSGIHRNDPDLRELGYSRNSDTSVAFTQNNPKAPWTHGSWNTIYPASRYFIDVKENSYQGISI